MAATRRNGIRLWYFLFAATIVVCFRPISPTADTKEAAERRVTQKSREEEIQAAVGRIVYVLRSEESALVSTELAQLMKPGASPISAAEATTFYELYRAPKGSPLVYFANPRIEMEDSRAVVVCWAHWQLVRSDRTSVRLKERERFVFEFENGAWVLREARSTPLIIKYGGDPGAYAASLVEIDSAVER